MCFDPSAKYGTAFVYSPGSMQETGYASEIASHALVEVILVHGDKGSKEVS
jgi:hypothetical protein